MSFEQSEGEERKEDFDFASLTAESVKEAILRDKPIKVKVKRSSGDMEEWELWGIDEKTGRAAVKKFPAEGGTLEKFVRMEKLKEWNS